MLQNNHGVKTLSNKLMNMQTEQNKNQAAVSLGKLGGLARAKKFTKEQLSEMGKKGGRPRKNNLPVNYISIPDTE